MKGRVVAVAIAGLLATAPLGCNGRPSPFKKTPAEAPLMVDAGTKKVALKKDQEPPKKLNTVPVKTGEKPEVQPVELNPFVAPPEETPKEKKKQEDDPYAGEMGPMKMLETKRSDYKPWEDNRTGYEVDDAGVRLDKKQKQETKKK